MLREVRLQILVEEVSLMVDGSEVILQDGHWLGYLEEGQGTDKFDKVGIQNENKRYITKS